MLKYSPVTLEDREWVEPIFEKCDRRGNDYTFSNLYDWSKPMNIEIADYKGCIVFKHMGKDGVYSCPMGKDGLADAIREIIRESHEDGHKIKLINVDEYDKKLLEENFPNKFEFNERRNDFDYIYDSLELGTMAGRKHRAKRNHVNQFVRMFPDWHYEEINDNNLPKVVEMARKWYDEAMETKEESIILEEQAVMRGLDNFKALDLRGGIIYADDENIASFCFGKNSCKDTMVVHAEKAFLEYPGAYTMIAKEFSYAVSGEYKYINREDDMGLEGLRTSKLSYRPRFFYKKFEAIER